MPEALQLETCPTLDVFPKCGHPRTPENTKPRPDGIGSCRMCKTENTRAWRERKRLGLPARGTARGPQYDFFDPTTKIGPMRRHVLDCYNSHVEEGMIPTNGRFIYYELESLGFVNKALKSDWLLVTDALIDLRKTNDPAIGVPYIPWDSIRDETRDIDENYHPVTLREAVESVIEYRQISLWHPEPPPMVICESRSLRGVICDLCSEFQVSITSVNGHCAGHLHTSVAKVIQPGQVVLYLGDLDWGGDNIEENTHNVLNEITQSQLTWDRVCITEEQVKEFGLTVIQKYNGVMKKTYPSVETEALGQGRIVSLLRDRLDKLMPRVTRERTHRRGSQERRQLLKLLAGLKGERR